MRKWIRLILAYSCAALTTILSSLVGFLILLALIIIFDLKDEVLKSFISFEGQYVSFFIFLELYLINFVAEKKFFLSRVAAPFFKKLEEFFLSAFIVYVSSSNFYVDFKYSMSYLVIIACIFLLIVVRCCYREKISSTSEKHTYINTGMINVTVFIIAFFAGLMLQSDEEGKLIGYSIYEFLKNFY